MVGLETGPVDAGKSSKSLGQAALRSTWLYDFDHALTARLGPSGVYSFADAAA